MNNIFSISAFKNNRELISNLRRKNLSKLTEYSISEKSKYLNRVLIKLAKWPNKQIPA